ncbi:hypothetical protein ABT354_28635 [Streptomyces sp. NPDC000594]|uniref:hypothetical protein n=1 Tax=Streptomyces sp. NPDC000594 TaxID=3154261 RepID=UPI00331F2C77
MAGRVPGPQGSPASAPGRRNGASGTGSSPEASDGGGPGGAPARGGYPQDADGPSGARPRPLPPGVGPYGETAHGDPWRPARPGAGPLPAEGAYPRTARTTAHPGTAPLPGWATAEYPAGATGARPRRPRGRASLRTLAAVACGLLGLGLIGGAATDAWLTADSSADTTAGSAYPTARTLWHTAPVDSLFPRTLDGEGAGPGRADRVWTRIAVAPDSTCAGQLPPALLTTLRPVGCARLLRATYTDATASHVTTVGLVFTEADATAMHALNGRFDADDLDRNPELMPRTLPAVDTVAERFTAAQRASWTLEVLTDAPVVVYAVSGFTDGRVVPLPQPADDARARGATTAPAQAGLGHEAQGVADAVTRALRSGVREATADAR